MFAGAQALADIGIQAEVIDRFPGAARYRAIVKSIKRTGRLLVVDNAWTCGASAEIVAQVVERAQNSRPVGSAHGLCASHVPDTPALERGLSIPPRSRSCHGMVKPDAKPWMPDAERSKLAYR
jgi:pyruvate/2-oxoglutarate/acetoin dehydrogenase E1 component